MPESDDVTLGELSADWPVITVAYGGWKKAVRVDPAILTDPPALGSVIVRLVDVGMKALVPHELPADLDLSGFSKPVDVSVVGEAPWTQVVEGDANVGRCGDTGFLTLSGQRLVCARRAGHEGFLTLSGQRLVCARRAGHEGPHLSVDGDSA